MTRIALVRIVSKTKQQTWDTRGLSFSEGVIIIPAVEHPAPGVTSGQSLTERVIIIVISIIIFIRSHFGSSSRLRVASYKSPSLLGPTEASVCVRWIRRYLSYMSQSWCCAGTRRPQFDRFGNPVERRV